MNKLINFIEKKQPVENRGDLLIFPGGIIKISTASSKSFYDNCDYDLQGKKKQNLCDS